MSNEVTLDTVMERRFDLVEAKAIIEGKHKAELEPLNEELRLCETFIKDEMNRSGMQQCKTSAGMAFFTTKDSVKVGDWDAVLAYIRENDAFNLLNQAVNKTAVKEFLETNQSAPPGVEYVAYRDLAWRRGKS
jgi:hypothetical protein